jgi:phosphatidate cytidylyltransferase
VAAGESRTTSALAARAGTAAVLVAGLLAALFLFPRPAYGVLVGLVMVLAGVEWARLCRLSAAGAWGYGAAVAIAFLACIFAEPWQVPFAIASAFWVIVVPLWLWHGVRPEQATGLAAAGLGVLVAAGLAMMALRPVELLLTLGGVWVADSAAYFAGRAWGRHKLAPSISPGKTREGALAGVVAVLVYATLCGLAIGQVHWSALLVSAAVLAVLSIYGDLFESALKRQAGRKDSGTLLPGHGGILDRIDSATAVLPVAALALPWIVAELP